MCRGPAPCLLWYHPIRVDWQRQKTQAAPTDYTHGNIRSASSLQHVLSWPNATSATSKLTTSRYAPSTTGWRTGVKAHVLICMLAAYLVWHLRHTLASAHLHRHPTTGPGQPRAPPGAPSPPPVRHRATATNTTSPSGPSAPCWPTWLPSPATASTSTAPSSSDSPTRTPAQRRAFELLATPIPITLT